MRARRHEAAGFTLLEVVISLAILAVSLVMLLTTNASSLENSARARDITIATLLARSKMIDLEVQLADEGFTEGENTEDGDFGEEGHPHITWTATTREVEISLDSLVDLCDGFMASDEMEDEEEGGCAAMLGGFGGMLEGLTSEIANSVRLLELTVSWPVGTKYSESFVTSTLVTREDLAMQQATDTLQDARDRAKQMGMDPDALMQNRPDDTNRRRNR